MKDLLYLDSSAIAKLVLDEPESRALSAEIANWSHLLSSAVAAIELQRAVGQLPDPLGRRREATEQVLASISLVPIRDRVVAEAASLGPPTLRIVDAIHLATVLSITDGSLSVATYDDVLTDALRENGVTVIAPGMRHKPGKIASRPQGGRYLYS